jgi:hypothetical protein
MALGCDVQEYVAWQELPAIRLRCRRLGCGWQGPADRALVRGGQPVRCPQCEGVAVYAGRVAAGPGSGRGASSWPPSPSASNSSKE